MKAQAPDIRAHLHQMWASVADGWAKNADYIDSRGAALTERLLELTRIDQGDRVLELACGPGSTGLVAAERAGSVLLSDVASEMIAIASARARERGLSNVTVRQLDLEAIDEADGSFDVVLCREGLMLVSDPAQAAREIVRVTRSGGRIGVAVWGPRECNPWLGVLFDAVSAQTGAPVPPPGVPGPFSLADRDELAALLSGAGIAELHVEEFDVPLHVASPDEWWERTTAMAGPLAKVLAALPEAAAQAIRERSVEGINRFQAPRGLEVPGVVLVASGSVA